MKGNLKKVQAPKIKQETNEQEKGHSMNLNDNINLNKSINIHEQFSRINKNFKNDIDNQIKNIQNDMNTDHYYLNESLKKLKFNISEVNSANILSENRLKLLQEEVNKKEASNKYYNERLLEAIINRKMLIEDFNISSNSINMNKNNNKHNESIYLELDNQVNQSTTKPSNYNKTNLLQQLRNNELVSQSSFIHKNEDKSQFTLPAVSNYRKLGNKESNMKLLLSSLAEIKQYNKIK